MERRSASQTARIMSTRPDVVLRGDAEAAGEVDRRLALNHQVEGADHGHGALGRADLIVMQAGDVAAGDGGEAGAGEAEAIATALLRRRGVHHVQEQQLGKVPRLQFGRVDILPPRQPPRRQLRLPIG
jgi:hypothetical protein